jgi:hypothetical protein
MPYGWNLKVTLNVNRTLSVNGDEEAQKEKVCSLPPSPSS